MRRVTSAHKAFRAFVKAVGGQGMVARLIGISQAQVSRIETARSTAGIVAALEIERAAGIPHLAWITGESVDALAVSRRGRSLVQSKQSTGVR